MAEAIESLVLQLRGHRHRRESDGEHRVVTIEKILQELSQAFARERVAGIFEESAAHIGVDTDDFEQMTVAVAGNG